MSKVTIKDVAKRAGVAISTASYALNNSNKVKLETKEKILKIAEEMNFTLNGAARDLKKSSKNIIGVIVPGVVGPYYSEIIHGIQEYSNSQGFGIIILPDYGEESIAVKFLAEARFDGAIIMAPSIDNSILERNSKKMPLVLLDRDFSADNVFCVLINNSNGILEVLKHLDSLSMKKIFVVTGSNSYDNTQRKNAIEMYKRNFSFDSLSFFEGNFTEESGYMIAKENFNCDNIPDAIISFNDEMSIGIVKHYHEIGVKVPEDVSIIGFDDIEIGRYITPKLSTVSYSKKKLGNIAAEILLSALKKESDIPRKNIIETKLILRESSK